MGKFGILLSIFVLISGVVFARPGGSPADDWNTKLRWVGNDLQALRAGISIGGGSHPITFVGSVTGKADSATYADTANICDTAVQASDSSWFSDDLSIVKDLDVDGTTTLDETEVTGNILLSGDLGSEVAPADSVFCNYCSAIPSKVDSSSYADTSTTVFAADRDHGGISSSSDDWTGEAGSDASPGGTWVLRTNKVTGPGTNVDVVIDTNYVTMDQGLVVTGQLKSQQCETFSWLEPDAVGAIGNGTALTFRYFDETTFPDGCTIDEIIMDASEAITDTFVVQEWSDAVGTSKSRVDSVMFSAANQVQITSGFDDADIAANAHLALLFRTAPVDFNLLKLTVIYTKD